MRILGFLFLTAVLVQGVERDVWAARGVISVAPAVKTFTSKDIEQLRTDPSSLLTHFPKGGPAMANYVARALIADVSLIEGMVTVAATATADQASAMGAGFARAARALSKNPDAVRTIAQKVAGISNQRLQISYRAIGANDLAFTPLIMPPDIQTPIPLVLNVGTLPPFESRIGPPPKNPPIPRTPSNRQKKRPADDDNLLSRGYILTAIVIRQPERNEVFSTSPTQ